MDDGDRNQWYELRRAVSQLERTVEANASELRGEIRSINIVLSKVVEPTLAEHSNDIDRIKTRFVVGITVMGSALTTLGYLALRGAPSA